MRIVVSGQVEVTDVASHTAVDDPQRLKLLGGQIYDAETCSDYLEGSLAAIGLEGGTLALVWDADASQLLLVTDYESPRKLTPQELKELTRATEGQWSDGIGEHAFDGLEKRFGCSVSYSLQPARARQLAGKRKAKSTARTDERNDRDGQGRTPLHQAVAAGDEPAALRLIKQGANVKTAAVDGETPLHAAAARGSAELLWALIERGAEVNAAERDGITPLMRAVMNNNRAAIEMLVREGASVNAQGTVAGARITALLWATHPEVVELLLQHGADPLLGDAPARTAADYFLNRAELAESDLRSRREAVRLRSIARLIQERLK